MIFVTVGTTTFNPLIKKIDELVAREKINDTIIAQISYGNYIPKHIQWFRFDPHLEKYFKSANTVITAGGAGTLFELCKSGKKVIATMSSENVWNPDIVQKLSKDKHILWCKNLEELENLIKKSKNFKFKKYYPPGCHINKKIIDFLSCPCKT